jgi:hypothetical protein
MLGIQLEDLKFSNPELKKKAQSLNNQWKDKDVILQLQVLKDLRDYNKGFASLLSISPS